MENVLPDGLGWNHTEVLEDKSFGLQEMGISSRVEQKLDLFD
ncbi:hypothetical protein FHX14_000432 [Rhizobium sp. BK619]|nr:hypothetical protein [Rhizobium sp. BK619]MBB3644273.1 hypothetical protein [Rhizobium sp. BK619]